MRYKTFRNLMVVGGLAAVGVGGWALVGRGNDAPAPAPPIATAAPTPPPVGDRQPLRPIDRRVLERLRAPIDGSDKVKDAFETEAIKVNLYQDAGHTLPNRVKLDLDRDDRFDEKWTVEGARISREISSSDDDRSYDQRWLLDGETWAREGTATAAVAPPPPAEPPPPAAPPPGALRPMDDEILRLARAGIAGD